MAVLLETSKGDIIIDMFCDDCPVTCKNFLKLCKIKYYNNCLFHYVQHNFLLQSGDPSATGKGGSSIYGKLYGDQARFFEDEIRPHLKHRRKGAVGMASAGKNLNASQFYITTGEEMDSLDEKHTLFGQVAEGFDVLDAINETFVDQDGRPYQNIRIRHAIILDDPFPDPPELAELIPDRSPPLEYGSGDRLEDDWVPTEDTRPADEVEAETRRAEAHHRAVVLEMVGDLPDADAKPPSNMLFICKLNPVTTEEDLEIIFSRFGNVTSCDIIRDTKTGDSLNYGFIGFDSDESCEAAYFKMNNAVIDDRRVKVDFSQSVFHLWKQFRKGGRQGTAAMAKDADQHVRSDVSGGKQQQGPYSRTAVAVRRSRLELKGSGAPHGGGGGGGGRHDLLLGAEDAGPAARPPAAKAAAQAAHKAPAPERPRPGTERWGAAPARDSHPAGPSGRERDRGGDRDRDQDRGVDRAGHGRPLDRPSQRRSSRSRSRERDSRHPAMQQGRRSSRSPERADRADRGYAASGAASRRKDAGRSRSRSPAARDHRHHHHHAAAAGREQQHRSVRHDEPPQGRRSDARGRSPSPDRRGGKDGRGRGHRDGGGGNDARNAARYDGGGGRQAGDRHDDRYAAREGQRR